MKFCGIDLGLDGGLAFYSPQVDLMKVEPMPTVSLLRNRKNKREIDLYAVARLIVDNAPDQVVMEMVGPFPGQGISGVFSMARGVGQIEGVIAAFAIPVTHIGPRVWIKAMRVRGGKDGSRFRATELFPDIAASFSRRKDDGVAEAALMAKWAADNHGATK